MCSFLGENEDDETPDASETQSSIGGKSTEKIALELSFSIMFDVRKYDSSTLYVECSFITACHVFLLTS